MADLASMAWAPSTVRDEPLINTNRGRGWAVGGLCQPCNPVAATVAEEEKEPAVATGLAQNPLTRRQRRSRGRAQL